MSTDESANSEAGRDQVPQDQELHRQQLQLVPKKFLKELVCKKGAKSKIWSKNEHAPRLRVAMAFSTTYEAVDSSIFCLFESVFLRLGSLAFSGSFVLKTMHLQISKKSQISKIPKSSRLSKILEMYPDSDIFYVCTAKGAEADVKKMQTLDDLPHVKI